MVIQTFSFARLDTDCCVLHVSLHTILSSGHMLGTACYTERILLPCSDQRKRSTKQQHETATHTPQEDPLCIEYNSTQKCEAEMQNNSKRQRVYII